MYKKKKLFLYCSLSKYLGLKIVRTMGPKCIHMFLHNSAIEIIFFKKIMYINYIALINKHIIGMIQ